MANDETWAAKVSTELKEEISQLVKESGLSSKEFLEQLISSHKGTLLTGPDAQRSEDIQQVTYHLDKIKASFIGLVEKGIDLQKKSEEDLGRESLLHKSIVDQQQLRIKLAHEERDKAAQDKVDLESLMTEIAARNEELEGNNKAHLLTINMQQDKLEQLEARVVAAQAIEDEVAQLNKAAGLQAKRIESLEQEAQEHKRELEQAQADKAAQEKDATKALEQLALSHRLELEKAATELERKLNSENHELIKEHYNELKALNIKNQELMEKLHQKEPAPKAKPKTKAAPQE